MTSASPTTACYACGHKYKDHGADERNSCELCHCGGFLLAARKEKSRRRLPTQLTYCLMPRDGVFVDVTVRARADEIVALEPEQLRAFMEGLAKVLVYSGPRHHKTAEQTIAKLFKNRADEKEPK